MDADHYPVIPHSDENVTIVAEMNATFISMDAERLKVRPNTGARIRGKGTRKRPPVSLRINFPSDLSWNGVTAINLNTKFTHLQVLGAAVLQISSGQQSC
jgi:hypothetical protein